MSAIFSSKIPKNLWISLRSQLSLLKYILFSYMSVCVNIEDRKYCLFPELWLFSAGVSLVAHYLPTGVSTMTGHTSLRHCPCSELQ